MGLLYVVKRVQTLSISVKMTKGMRFHSTLQFLNF